MKTAFKAIMLATAALGTGIAIPTIASAQAVGGVAVADLDKAVADSAAYAGAVAQIKSTYAAPIAAVEARSKVLQGELQALVTAFQAAQKAPNANQAALQTQYGNIQAKQQAAQAELQRMSTPFDRARAYAVEQITAKLSGAAKTVMTARNVGVVVPPQATVLFAPTADVTAAITAELNKSVPVVSIAVPATWQPGGAAPAAAPAGTPAATPRPTTPAPTGR
jgi:Skp family chaperone for outer membrane proteins